MQELLGDGEITVRQLIDGLQDLMAMEGDLPEGGESSCSLTRHIVDCRPA